MQSLPYLLLLLYYLLIFLLEFYDSNKKRRLEIRLACIIPFIIFFGFRGNIGSDWYNYQFYYSITSLKEWTILDFELGFSLITKVFSDLNIPYSGFVLFITIIQVWLFDKIIKNYSGITSLSYAILISLFPLLIIDLLRNFTSLLIAMQSIAYIYNNKKIKAVLIILLSISFHATGILFFILFFIQKKVFNKKVIMAWLGVGLLLYISQIRFYDFIVQLLGKIFGGRIEYLTQTVVEETKSYGITFGIIEKLIFTLIFIISHNYIVRKRLILPVFFNLFYIYICIYLYFSTSETFINRFSLLFFPGYMISLSHIYGATRIKELKKVFVFLLIVVCLLKTYLTFDNILYRYTNNLIEIDNIEQRDTDRYNHYLNQ